MATFTSSLPDELLKRLSETAKELDLPKNKLIEKALEVFLDEIKRAKYARSYKRAAQDEEIMQIAEEGMADYFRMLQEFDKK
jgi:predicted transcriptional regulator